MLNGPYGTRIFLPQIAQIDTEEKHHRCLYIKNTRLGVAPPTNGR